MKKFVIGFAAGLIVVPLAIYAYFAYGMAPVATATSEMPFERLLAKKALRVRREREMQRSVPIATDESNYAAGAHIYREHCGVCHGLSKQPQTAIAKGMYPKPPALVEGKGVTDDLAGGNLLEGGWRHPHVRYAWVSADIIQHRDVAS